jgi:hypothetical protein
MFNVGETLVVFFFAYASFFCRKELLTTSLGKAVLTLILLTYLSRAVEEVILWRLSGKEVLKYGVGSFSADLSFQRGSLD